MTSVCSSCEFVASIIPITFSVFAQIKSSSRFNVEGKYVRLAAKD